ncbi:MAG: hypothetical protein DME76_15925 [Verrucomicrobia bacterium]|nr:MAG: hypothetical protein DME76_15925 [Verrucomicrobiota bacterium]
MKEWELRVSQRELQRMHVVRLTLEGHESVGKGAKVLGISARQMKRETKLWGHPLAAAWQCRVILQVRILPR